MTIYPCRPPGRYGFKYSNYGLIKVSDRFLFYDNCRKMSKAVIPHYFGKKCWFRSFNLLLDGVAVGYNISIYNE